MKNTTEQRDSKKVSIKTEASSSVDIETSEKELNPIVKAKDEIKETYNSHVKAQKEFENAFRQLNKKDQEAYEIFEQKYQAYEEAIQKAFKVREAAELEALTAYQANVERAAEYYRRAMKSALQECKAATEEARKELLEIAKGESSPMSTPQPFSGFSRSAVNSLNDAKVKIAQGLISVKNSLMN